MNNSSTTSPNSLAKLPLYRSPGIWLFAWALLILFLSCKPRIQVPLYLFSYQDKLFHALFYMPLGYLAIAHWRNLDTFPKIFFNAILMVTVWCATYGFAIECAQFFIPGRGCEVLDGVADTIGSCLGAYIALRWIPLFLRRPR